MSAGADAVEPLDAPKIRAAAAVGWLREVHVFATVDSTNAYLLARPPPPFGTLDACVAERQTRGRGRRGRAWYAPAGGLYLSMAWRFAARPPDLAALSLVAGVAAADALAAGGVGGVQLKWPNDLVWDDRKLGGILVELKAEADGAIHAVIGVGINIRLPAQPRIDRPGWGRGPVDLFAATGRAMRRDLLAGALLAATGESLRRFEGEGFAPFDAAFAAADWLFGRQVRVAAADQDLEGAAQGVAADGRLRVWTADGVRHVQVGEVSVVPVSGGVW